MKVTKRTGKLEEVSFDKILKRIKQQCYNLNKKFVDPVEIATKVIQGLTEGIKTSDLDVLASETSAMMTANHPDFAKLAARISLSNLYKETYKKFSEAVEFISKNSERLDSKLVELVLSNRKLIDSKIDNSRDEMFDYFGFKTLEKSYLIKIDNKIIETPQYLYMRVSLGIWGDNFEEAFKTYDLLSKGYFTHATPTLFNAGTPKPQMSSCFLIANKGDSVEGICDTFKEVAKISSMAGGIGIHLHDLRANGSHIKGSGGTARGILPYLKSMNEWSKYFDQGGGKRKGSFAIYLEPWHKDIHTLLDIRKNHGKEELRARELFTALWIPDLFMKRVEIEGKWTLFCPNEVLIATGKKLQDVYGEEFEELYIKCELLGIGKEINARDLWLHIINSQIETGSPYMTYKDAVNKKSNQKNIGTIKSLNLCAEIAEYSDEKETAVCNLASVALPKYVENLKFDFNLLHSITRQIVRNLNQIIDVNYYPTNETNYSNLKNRPIGIGVQGLGDVFALMKYSYDSKEAKELNKRIFETIYHAAITESISLASKFGVYENFTGSPTSKGEFQFELWGNNLDSELFDWEEVKKLMKLYGLRNSLLLAQMPTASTGQILGNNEACEPFNSNLSTRSTLAGTFPIINKHLIRDLEELNLWNKDIKNKLILENGSVQNIPEIPVELKERYKTAYEISQKVIIDMAADRGAFICQSQSMNIFMANPSVAKLSSMHFYGWKAGLKTGMYYLRTKAAADAIKFTVEEEKTNLNCSLDNKDDCLSCGS